MSVVYFWLGRLGSMVPLASPEPGVENPLELKAGVHESLNGTTTLDVLGYRRTWSIQMAHLLHDDLSYLESCYTGVVQGPLRFLDPTRKNRLSLPASVGDSLQSWSGAATAWRVVPAGTSSVSSDQGWPSISYTADDGRTVTYSGYRSRRWAPNGASERLTADARRPAPALPGETLTLSAHLKVTSPQTATLRLVPVDAAGANLTPVAATPTSSTTWTRKSITYTVPASGVAGVYPEIVSGGSSGEIFAAAMQIEEGDATTSWALGTGCPEVLITGLGAESARHPLVSVPITIRER